MLNFLIVFIGGGLGSASRYAVSLGFANQKALATISVNVIGCFLIAIADGLLKKYSISISTHLRLLFITGFLGGFTTYSSFLLDIFNYNSSHGLPIALVYVASSIFLGVASFGVGFYLLRVI